MVQTQTGAIIQPVPQPLPRFQRHQEAIADRANIDRVVDQAMPEPRAKATAAGDSHRLRGIPAVGVRNGVGSAIPGTDPVKALMRKERER
jgi:hypothetical protein